MAARVRVDISLLKEWRQTFEKEAYDADAEVALDFFVARLSTRLGVIAQTLARDVYTKGALKKVIDDLQELVMQATVGKEAFKAEDALMALTKASLREDTRLVAEMEATQRG